MRFERRAVEEQGHGRTTDRDAPIRFATSADDVAVLLRQLAIEKADVMGFSNGASVAMELAIRHPEVVRKLVFASSMTKRSGAAPQFWQLIEGASFASMPDPLEADFLAVNPDPKKLRTMHDEDLERMQHFVEIPDATVKSVRAPTLVLLGDRDVPTPEHAVELTPLLPHARLLVLPGGHGDYLGEIMAPKSDAPETTRRLSSNSSWTRRTRAEGARRFSERTGVIVQSRSSRLSRVNDSAVAIEHLSRSCRWPGSRIGPVQRRSGVIPPPTELRRAFSLEPRQRFEPSTVRAGEPSRERVGGRPGAARGVTRGGESAS